jgi:formate hydrogenlyase subunit 6/NADH:ubiquinone oxidoreductase subunit I
MPNPFKIPMLGQSLKNLMSPPATRRYPAEARVPFEGTRGHVEMDLSTCVFCGLCARKCPSKAIVVSREQKTFALEHLRCIACEVCVEACNKDSLKMAVEAPRVYTASEAGPQGTSPRGREEGKAAVKPVPESTAA